MSKTFIKAKWFLRKPIILKTEVSKEKIEIIMRRLYLLWYDWATNAIE